MSKKYTKTFIVAAKRTPFGSFGGKLKGFTATELGVFASKGAISQINLDPKLIDSVIIGNVQQTSGNAAYLARHIGLHSGVKIDTPSLIVNRLCGSGFQSVINAYQEIQLGESEIVLAGGTESMSQAPYAVRNARFGTQLGVNLQMEDTLWQGLTDEFSKTPMAITAENLAEKYNITREESDKYSILSQQRYQKAKENGVFKDEIVPIEITTKKGTEVYDFDEHPRPQTTIEALAKLPSLFKKNGTVTAGSASGISDGASILIIASENAVKKYGLKPLVEIVSYGISGVEPNIMGIGPVPSIKKALSRANLTLDQIDYAEVNEAFASQWLSVEKELGLDRNKTNVNGGAIALGHPLGASGARILTNLTYQLLRTKTRYGLGSACIGGGQGIAVVLENNISQL
eukprot:TRINITY_DN2099_c0_g1_i1.p1 TRINITY_DN2099_c0_g1~~TRINITY_DN2099_c0_g1_i1.p1  ORF type:complete len:402 (-),score=140.97 TRINITY_DN2099_c0_g1_i1:18-1223(-)